MLVSEVWSIIPYLHVASLFKEGKREKEMNIPSVNATITDIEREKTKRVCELLGWGYETEKVSDEHPKLRYACGVIIGYAMPDDDLGIMLPNGSLTLDQCVGMLEDLNVEYCGTGWAYTSYTTELLEKRSDGTAYIDKYCEPHNLTTALNALIKVLEEKK